MNRKNTINEKLSYKTKSNQWRELRVRGDVIALAEELGVTRVTISKAINHGVGGLDLLKSIDRYFEERQLHGKSDYLPDERKNFLT